MGNTEDDVAEAAWQTAVAVVELIRWEREEQMAEAVVEIAVVVEDGLRRYLAERRRRFGGAAGDPGRN